MSRLLLAVALVVVCAAPVSTASGQTQTKTKHTPQGPTSERLRNALGGFNSPAARGLGSGNSPQTDMGKASLIN